MLARFLAVAALIVASSVAFAGQVGYTRHGKTVIVYKDGKKVGDWPEAVTDDRAPANAPAPNDTLYFIDDTTSTGHAVRCYAMSNLIGFAHSEPISCVRAD